jgi:cholesterol transport system auxiliary component
MAATAPSNTPAGVPLVLAEIETSAALDSTAVLYRLAYADAQVLRPYAQARWSMPPAQLVRLRLRSQLGVRRAVINPGDVTLAAPAPGMAPAWVLRTELEEFSQLFESPTASSGLVRLRATVTQASPQGDRLLGQRSFVAQRPAPAPDAAGGVRALGAATDAVAADIEQWLLQLR